MDRREFIGICEKLIGYDAIIMIDKSVIHRYCRTPDTLLFLGTIVDISTVKYGWISISSPNRYTAIGDAKVLYCDSNNIYMHVQTKKQKLHRAVKDFKCIHRNLLTSVIDS